jgi:hypothetical protein
MTPSFCCPRILKTNKEYNVKENPIEYVASKIIEEEAPYKFQKMVMVLRKLYQSLPTGDLWVDFPEYFKEYQLEE